MGCRRRAQLRWPLANPGGAAIRAKCWLIVIGECEPKVGAMGNGEICAERGGALTGMCGVMGRGRFLGVVFLQEQHSNQEDVARSRHASLSGCYQLAHSLVGIVFIACVCYVDCISCRVAKLTSKILDQYTCLKRTWDEIEVRKLPLSGLDCFRRVDLVIHS